MGEERNFLGFENLLAIFAESFSTFSSSSLNSNTSNFLDGEEREEEGRVLQGMEFEWTSESVSGNERVAEREITEMSEGVV